MANMMDFISLWFHMLVFHFFMSLKFDPLICNGCKASSDLTDYWSVDD